MEKTSENNYLEIIHANIKALTQPSVNHASHTVWIGDKWKMCVHTTDQPSLLDQLEQSLHFSPQNEGKGNPATMLNLRTDALDCIDQIRRAVAEWAAHLASVTPRPRKGPGSLCIGAQRLIGLVSVAGIQEQADLARDSTRWVHHARIVSGWESPAWRPRATCPSCETFGDLRVRLARNSAICLYCRTCWTPENLDDLAAHIRGENARAQIAYDAPSSSMSSRGSCAP